MTKIILGEAYALYHKRPRKDGRRVWEGDPGTHNVELGGRYWEAKGDPEKMTVLCSEHPLPGAVFPVGPGPGAIYRPPETYVAELARPRQPVGWEAEERPYGGTRVGEQIRI